MLHFATEFGENHIDKISYTFDTYSGRISFHVVQ